MRLALLAIVALLAAGCATRPDWLGNRLACTVDRSQLHVLSVWGPFSIGSIIDAGDAAIVCAPGAAR